MKFWSDLETQQLIALRADGQTFGQIALVMGRSRSQIAGKVMRDRIGGNKLGGRRSSPDRLRQHTASFLRMRVRQLEALLEDARAALAVVEP